MSAKTANKIILTTAQILEAHAAHGDDFVVINFESTRKFKNYSQYIDIDIKLADGTVCPVRYWKLSNDGIVVASRIRKPEQRKYEAIRLGVALMDDNQEINENSLALKLLCEAFENKMRQYKNDGVITDDERAPRKQADGTYRPFHLISTKIVTPMQTTAIDRENDDIVELENPKFWLSLPKRKFYKAGQSPPESVHFDDKYYVDESGQPDLERPVMTHEYAMDVYNVDDTYFDQKTGRKIFKKLGAPQGDNNVLDNTNIQEYFTKGSALLGSLKFELAVSGRQAKLDVSLYGRVYCKIAEVVEGGAGNAQDQESVDDFAARYASIGTKTATPDNANIPDDDADIGDDF
jgi:hypothetical protein